MFKLYDDTLFVYSLLNPLEIKDKILSNLTQGGCRR